MKTVSYKIGKEIQKELENSFDSSSYKEFASKCDLSKLYPLVFTPVYFNIQKIVTDIVDNRGILRYAIKNRSG